MKELRALAWILSLSTLALLGYGAFAPGRAAGTDPVISITEPEHGASVKGAVTVAVAYRSVSGASITHLQFYVDRKPFNDYRLQAPSPEGAYSFVWDTSSLAPGPHNIWAYAIDSNNRAGNVAISIYVKDNTDLSPGGRMPAVSVRGLRDGQVVGNIVQVMADVLGNVPVKWVEFHVDDRFRAATNRPPYQYSWDTSRYPNGPHSVKVYVFDAGDNRGESTPVTVEVNNPGGLTPPGKSADVATQPEAAPKAEPAKPTEPIRMALANRVPAVAGPSTSAPTSIPTIDITLDGQGTANEQAAPAAPVEPPTVQATKPSVSTPGSFQIAVIPTAIRYETDLTPVARPSASRSVIPGDVAPMAPTKPVMSASVPPVNITRGLDSILPMARELNMAPAAESAAQVTTAPASIAAPRLSSATSLDTLQVATNGAAAASSPSFEGATSRSPEPISAGLPQMSVMSEARLVVVPVPGSFQQARAESGAPFTAAELRQLMPSAQEAPHLDPANRVPQGMTMANGTARVAMAPSAGDTRMVQPLDRSVTPTVSDSGNQPSRALIALVDTQHQRAYPVAMLVTHATEPPCAPRTLPAGAATPPSLPTMVISTKKNATVSVVYNGKSVHFGDVPPVIRDGMTLAPFRHIIEHSGGSVVWSSIIKQVKASADGHHIEFTIGNPQATVNNRSIQMQAAPYLKDGRAIVPVSFLRDALDVVVEYDPQTGKVTIAAK